MSRSFIGTVEELDSDLLMVWQALRSWEKREDIAASLASTLRGDLRKSQIERELNRRREMNQRPNPTKPPRPWVKSGRYWEIDGYPFQIRPFPLLLEFTWVVVGEEDESLSRIAGFESLDEARIFVEKRCDDIDRFEEGP